MGWCGHHQRPFKVRCVACHAEKQLREDLEDSQAAWRRRQRELSCPNAPRDAPSDAHWWQGELGRQVWVCIHCGRIERMVDEDAMVVRILRSAELTRGEAVLAPASPGLRSLEVNRVDGAAPDAADGAPSGSEGGEERVVGGVDPETR